MFQLTKIAFKLLLQSEVIFITLIALSTLIITLSAQEDYTGNVVDYTKEKAILKETYERYLENNSHRIDKSSVSISPVKIVSSTKSRVRNVKSIQKQPKNRGISFSDMANRIRRDQDSKKIEFNNRSQKDQFDEKK